MSRMSEHKEDTMADHSGGLRRRDFLALAGVGAATGVAATSVAWTVGATSNTAAAATTTLGLAATDGYLTAPGREGDPLYIFGFIPVDPAKTVSQLASYKGHAQHTAPTLDFLQGQDAKITLTNLGLVQRPDLTDSHTIHWHGFDLPSPLNDGVPEVSVAVPIGRQLTYFYRPHREGTYMYHCHFEDVEHVQMGMTGIVFVRPTQDGTSHAGFTRFAYNDGDGSTGYHRHFAILLNELWSTFHDGDRDIQESIATDYNPQWFTLNGRCYPQTLLPNDSPSLPASLRISTPNPNYGDVPDFSQPNSSLVQVNPGDRVLLRLANLGYQQHSLQLPGIRLHVIGQDASLLRAGSVDTSYYTNTLYLGPGEARDVLFDAPAYDPASPSGTDGRGAYNVYTLSNRDWRRLSSLGGPDASGMRTEVRVYEVPLPAQDFVSQTYV
jgi:FtsP/CotA-like multicopper oxidase with cupredoxin domain